MPNDVIAQLIADKAANLQHPDGVPTKLAEFNTATLPPAMREHIAADLNQRTKRIGEAIVNEIELAGYQIIAKSAVAEMQARAGELGDGNRGVPVHCAMPGCDELLFTLVPSERPDKISTHGPALIGHLASRSPVCPHGLVTT